MTTLAEEYVGEQGRAQLLRSLKLTQLIGDAKLIAEEVAKHVELVTCKKGEALIRQNAADDDIYLLLQGRVKILVDGHEVAIVNAGGHVGELALIDPRAFRCASAVTIRDTITAKVTQKDFVEIANRHPALWRRTSQILGERLREFNRHVKPPNPRPRVFFGCASRELGHQLESRLRSERFLLSPFLAESGGQGFPTKHLEAALADADLAIIARLPGDLSAAGGPSFTPRETLLYLCGACAGGIGASRTILIEPDDQDAALLTAQFGIPSLTYPPLPQETHRAGLDAIAVQVQEFIGKLGTK